MKKILSLLLCGLLILSFVGCDRDGAAEDTAPETVVGTSAPDVGNATEAVTTPAETNTPATDTPATGAPETEAGTEAPTDAVLTAEEAEEVLAEMLANAILDMGSAMTVTTEGRSELTLALSGFTSTVTLPVTGHYATDGKGNLTQSQRIPMMGDFSCTMVDGTIYYTDGDKRIACSFTADDLADGSLSLEFGPEVSDDWASDFELPTVELGGLTIPAREVFASVSGVYDGAADRVTLTLSGLSDDTLAALEKLDESLARVEELLSANAEESDRYPGLDFGTLFPADEIDPESFSVLSSVRTLRDLVAACTASPADFFTMTLVMDGNCRLESVTYSTTLRGVDSAVLPAMTIHTEVTATLERGPVTVKAPADAAEYERVPLSDLIGKSEE